MAFLKTPLLVLAVALLLHAATSNKEILRQKTILDIFGTAEEYYANCSCVPQIRCKVNKTESTFGEMIIDLRLNVDNNPCASYLEVCCKKSDQIEKSSLTTSSPKVGCGKRNFKGVGFRITGNKGNEAEFGEFPWMVAVLCKESISRHSEKLYRYRCGGSLIHRQVVLTAAHCFKPTTQYIIRAGEWDTQTQQEHLPHQDRKVVSVKIHEQYYAGAVLNDLALMFLEKPVDIAENVNVICLPTQATIFDHSRCVVSGWGKDVFGKEGHYQVILKKIDLPIVPKDDCQSSLRKTRLGGRFQLHNSFICAGGEIGKDVCTGDGGSPLVCPIKGNEDFYQQAGIVAWGIGCGTSAPGVYVNVALFRDWIDQQIAAKNFDHAEVH